MSEQLGLQPASLQPEEFGPLFADLQGVLISAEQIARRVRELGRQISLDYAPYAEANAGGSCPLLVGVLKGVMPFMADLLRSITIPVHVDFLAVASYSAQSREKGVVRLQKDLEESITGRHVLFVEDVIDTGLTLSYLLRNLRAREPASLEVCTLFNKPHRRLVNLPVRYLGFDLPDRFVVGYGLDYRERYRNLPFVALLKPEVFRRQSGSAP
jgi:hypoxanthine phosphoribosyltransferase